MGVVYTHQKPLRSMLLCSFTEYRYHTRPKLSSNSTLLIRAKTAPVTKKKHLTQRQQQRIADNASKKLRVAKSKGVEIVDDASFSAAEAGLEAHRRPAGGRAGRRHPDRGRRHDLQRADHPPAGSRAPAAAAPWPVPALVADNAAQWPELLRRYRAAESTRLVWRDVHGLDTVDDTLAGTTRLAEVCLQTALEALEAEFAQRHGVVRAPNGSAQRLVVFGLGKLGGGELNVSSDIDLIFAYEEEGETTQGLSNQDFFTKLGMQNRNLAETRHNLISVLS